MPQIWLRSVWRLLWMAVDRLPRVTGEVSGAISMFGEVEGSLTTQEILKRMMLSKTGAVSMIILFYAFPCGGSF